MLKPAINPVPIASPRIAFLLMIRVFVSISFPLFEVILCLVCCRGSSKRLMLVFISFSCLLFGGHPVFSCFSGNQFVVICNNVTITGQPQGAHPEDSSFFEIEDGDENYMPLGSTT